MYTVSESVTGKVDIWAIPRSEWAPKDNPPFSYALYTGTVPYQDGAVKVHSYDVTLEVPAGINLLQAAMDTLEDAKVKARETYMEQIRKLDQQIKNLQMITHQPEPKDVVGEFIPAPPAPDLNMFDDDIPF